MSQSALGGWMPDEPGEIALAGTTLHGRVSAACHAAEQLLRKADQTYGVLQAERATVERLTAETTRLAEEIKILALTETALAELLQHVSADSVQAVEQTITYGLRTVFDDHPLTFKFVQSQQRGAVSLEPVLEYQGVTAPILGAFGGGPASVVAFLLRLLVCHRLQLYPLLLLDESFAFVSARYRPNLATLLRELSEKLGFTFVLVSHDDVYLDHADRAYRVVETSSGVSFLPVAWSSIRDREQVVS